MPKPIGSNTGNAQIVKQGHTSTGTIGDDPNMKGKGNRTPRDLGVKRSK